MIHMYACTVYTYSLLHGMDACMMTLHKSKMPKCHIPALRWPRLRLDSS